jgi:heat shock protein HtpX
MIGRMILMFGALTALFLAIGAAVGYFFFGDPITFMGIALVFAAILNFVSYFYSDKIVLWSTHTKLINENEDSELFDIVRRVSTKAGIRMPKVGIVQSNQPNAFATGRDPNNAVVVVTTRIRSFLTPSELEAVIGHEISHVTHRDIRVGAIAATLAGAISFIGNMMLWSMWFGGYGGGRNRNGGGAAVIGLLVAAILIPLGASMVQLGISRSRESFADEAGAKLTRRPQELMDALRKISGQVQAHPMQPSSNSPGPSTSSLWIVNPFKGSALTELFSTHPSLEHRLEKLRKVAHEMGIYVH